MFFTVEVFIHEWFIRVVNLCDTREKTKTCIEQKITVFKVPAKYEIKTKNYLLTLSFTYLML